MNVTLTAKTWGLAKQYQAEVIEAINLRRGPDSEDYTELDAADKWAFGYLGEQAVKCILTINGKHFTHHWDTSGRAAGPDFGTNNTRGYEKHLEVKTASSPHHGNLAFPDKQRKHVAKSDVVIGARIMSSDAGNGQPILVSVEGWIAKKDWLDVTPQGPDNRWSVPTIAIPFIQLEPMQKLLDMIMPKGGDAGRLRFEAIRAQQKNP